jgi:hypothetical protein
MPKVHVPALADIAASYLVAGIAERREHLGHRVIDQDVAIGQEQNLRAAVLARAVPATAPELPANLEGHAGLAGAGGQRGEDALLAEQNRLDHAVDGNLLVVAWHLAGCQVEGLQQMRRRPGAGGRRRQTGEQFVGRGVAFDLALGAWCSRSR